MSKRTYVNPRELLGGTIQSVIPHADAHGQPFSVLMIITVPVRKRGGKMETKTYQAETWRDPEGNGPGFLYVEDLENKPERPRRVPRKGVVKVSFKHEDLVQGQPIGPMHFHYEDGSDRKVGWVTYSQAKTQAKTLKAEFMEF